MSDKPLIDLWAAFLANDKLEPKRTDEAGTMTILRLCEELVKRSQPPFVFCPFRSHPDRLRHRKMVAETAMDLGIDLMAIRHKGKPAMGRGLIDAWNAAYAERFGSTYGTAGAKEVARRTAKTTIHQSRP